MAQRLQVVVEDRLAEAVKALADRDGRTVSEWARLLLDRVVARAESNGALELPDWCVGCGAKAGKGALVCRECAALMDAEDAEDLPAHPRMVGDTKLAIKVWKAQPSRGIVRGEPVMCAHDEVEKRTTPALGTRRFCKDCGALLP